MELRALNTFIKAAELQSFSKAAEELGYSQAAVTIQIKGLETDLGIPLFERIGKRVRLTDAGEQFLHTSLNVMKELETAKHNLGNSESIQGTLRIATPESMLISILPQVILKFHDLCPNVSIETKTGTISELFDMVKQNDTDLLLFLDEKVHLPEWNHVLEHEERIVFVAASNNPLTQEKQIPIERLIREPFILTEQGNSYRFIMEQMLAQQGLTIQPFLETGNTDVISNMLLHHAGVSFIPEYVVTPYLQDGSLKILDVDFAEINMWSQLVYHKNKWVTPQMEVFVGLLRECFS